MCRINVFSCNRLLGRSNLLYGVCFIWHWLYSGMLWSATNINKLNITGTTSKTSTWTNLCWRTTCVHPGVLLLDPSRCMPLQDVATLSMWWWLVQSCRRRKLFIQSVKYFCGRGKSALDTCRFIGFIHGLISLEWYNLLINVKDIFSTRPTDCAQIVHACADRYSHLTQIDPSHPRGVKRAYEWMMWRRCLFVCLFVCLWPCGWQLRFTYLFRDTNVGPRQNLARMCG